MRVTYLLDKPELGGGTKVVLQHARLLADRGHAVTVAAEAAQPAWIAPWIGRGVGFVDLSRSAAGVSSQDLVVATFWTTIARAESLSAGPVAHFCQGFEEDLAHLAPQLDSIRAAYRRPLPALVVAPHLGLRLREQFGRQSRLAPAPADVAVSRRWRWRPRRRPWVALGGIFEAEVKGIRTGLAALEALAAAAAPSTSPGLLRISALPCTAAERELYPPAADARYLAAVAPRVALRALAGCDLLLFTSGPGEGFGLPLLEAMQLGVPAVASRLPGVEFMAGDGGAWLVEAGDAEAFARAAATLLASPAVWRRQRRRGIAAAARFAPAGVAHEVEAALVWAATAATAATPATPASIATARTETGGGAAK
ncbi:MAG: glycosyltransferase family 4 protein [Thermoanaerobaculia bacterium]